MKLSPHCICCQLNHQEQRIRPFTDRDKKSDYMKQLLLMAANADENDTAPSLSVAYGKLFSQVWGVPGKDYTEIKKEFNLFLMKLEDKLTDSIASAPDPLETALLYARAGNYIDFSAVKNISGDDLLRLFEKLHAESLDPIEYANLKKELSEARTLVYLLDNCGEIVIDKIVIALLQKLYPQLAIHAVVRGMPVSNDATMEDALQCRLTDIVPVTENGSDVGGTWLAGINDQTRELLHRADLILSKGQGNFETLGGCGLNIYYLFLCKCDYFMQMFQAEQFQGMLVNEKRLPLFPG